MKITFISQASVVIETSDATIWTDPWLVGTAFNNSWKLFPEPKFDEQWYKKIDFLWISHEHPDHFHIPTLKALPVEFKENVTLLFQDNNSNKMIEAFKKLGFKKITLLKNRKVTSITPLTKVHNTQIGQMDSSLAVIADGKTVLNLNDCEINSYDAKLYKKDLGKIDIVLNQFSMAGYNGHINYQEVLPKESENILNTMVSNHRDLEASITIPIASYIYFCQEDNKFMNEYSNSPESIHQKFLSENLECIFLSVNESIDLDRLEDVDKESSYQRMKDVFDKKGELQMEVSQTVALGEIEEAFVGRYNQLKMYFPQYILNKLSVMKVFIPDLGKTINLSLANGIFKEVSGNNSQQDFDIQINSQPLYFAFKFKWGVQTLGVSARYFIKNNYGVWKWYRIVTSLNNAELYLKPKYIFHPHSITYLVSRLKQLPNQLKYQLSRME